MTTKIEQKVVLIVEDDPVFSNALAESFFRRGFQVFIETTTDKARRRLQVLMNSSTRLDVALIDETKDAKASYFADLLHQKYVDIKTVLFSDKNPNEILSKAAIIPRTLPPEIIIDAASDAIDYSQSTLKKHLETLAVSDRAAKIKEQQYALGAGSMTGMGSRGPSQEIVEAAARFKVVCKKLAITFMDVMQADNLEYRRWLFSEYKKQLKLLKYTKSFAKLRKMVYHYHKIKGAQKAA
jgi:hypothetical protein